MSILRASDDDVTILITRCAIWRYEDGDIAVIAQGEDCCYSRARHYADVLMLTPAPCCRCLGLLIFSLLSRHELLRRATLLLRAPCLIRRCRQPKITRADAIDMFLRAYMRQIFHLPYGYAYDAYSAMLFSI